MKRYWILIALVALALVAVACAAPAAPAPAPAPAQPTAAPAQPTAAPAQSTAAPAQPTAAPAQPTAATAKKEIKLGYVLHGLNDFTQVIKKGAEDAGKALGIDVEVTGPAGFVSNEEIAMFEAMVQKKKDGLAVVPQPGDVWVAPIKEATDVGIPVMTANVTSPESTAAAWVGQDEYQSGVLLANALKKILADGGVTKGKIVVGACVPSVQVLIDRYNGFKKGFEGSAFEISTNYDVTPENTSNYSAWENLASANKDMVAAVGLCSLDIPNLAQLKKRTNATWAIGGYDLNVPSLDAIKDGSAQVTVGQQPYLQGYLPILALAQSLQDGKPLPKGWVDVGTEVVTKENVDTLYKRESDQAFMTQFYADYIKKNFANDLNSYSKPLPDHSKDAAAPTGPTVANPKIGYVLHGLNDFTQVIKKGAEDAGKALGVDVEVTGPAGFVSNEEIAMFEAMVQKKKDGLAVVPQPGDVWVAPIKEATDVGIPVQTANVTSADSTALAWFGQDEYQSGVLLADALKKILADGGVTKGKIVVGACVPSVQVLIDRYNGFKKGFEGSAFEISTNYDVTPENTSNYSAWENLASANKDMVAAVGLCSLDIPNLAQLKKRTNATWAIGGYDLNVPSLDAIKDGSAQVTVGQQPYLQGYLPVLALVNQLRDGKPAIKGWVDVGTEVVTKANVDDIYKRESDQAFMTQWYADYIKKNFSDLNAVAKPTLPTH